MAECPVCGRRNYHEYWGRDAYGFPVEPPCGECQDCSYWWECTPREPSEYIEELREAIPLARQELADWERIVAEWDKEENDEA
jgi:hypothetical protein